ncbi:MAG: bifunctional [glutamine synthetase] adenylyltransferase/[glutamine synthetase]-adenylyl-L-tyrosine phosphorylase [Rhizobiales bacterium]|nr:bifunctional [glutamine synthetase] adenylyltransferase/[glutamine synthetase]-adenylyl-L-tyrosine phosphorylase [Hyphomicrobiales bacterium]
MATIHPQWLEASAPPAYDSATGRAHLADLVMRIAAEHQDGAFGEALAASPVGDLLASVLSASPYLAGIARRSGAEIARLLSTSPGEYFELRSAEVVSALAAANTINEAMRALRQYKSAMAFSIALADAAGIDSTDLTVARLSDVAERSLGAALAFLFRQARERGEVLDSTGPADTHGGFFILGMGKLGARELNYSSDIDLVIFHEPGRLSLRPGLEPQVFLVRLVRLLVKLMQDQTADGYVFRTDLRLRPDPGSTQVVMTTDAAFNYYEGQGQNWERAAFIKARVVAGDRQAGEAFLSQLAPFIWRKYLDYAAIADIHAMKRQIHANKGFSEIRVAGHNIKLGRGGIREIEFFAQTQQLIAGGRQPELRLRRTVEALSGLAARGWITPEACRELTETYWFLRHVENRIQMVADEQTHVLPSDADRLRRLAAFSGFASVEEFASTLRRHLETVQNHYAALFEDVPELTTGKGNLVFVGDSADPATLETLTGMGFTQPEGVWQTVRSWHFGRYPAMRSARARERLTELQPRLIETLGQTAAPDAALAAFDRFLSELPAGIQLFGLLRSNPSLLSLLAMIMGTAPRLQALLSRRRRVLEAVLDPGFFGQLPSDDEVKRVVEAGFSASSDLQDALDRARVIASEQTFLIGVRLLSGVVSPIEAGLAYARLASRLLHRLQSAVRADFERQHGVLPGGDAALVGMGKLGGYEMTAASDLDLILIYDYEGETAASDGPRPLPGGQYFARFTQRLVSAVTSPTAEGRLYEVDMRLRPSGNSGPIATRLASFQSYQRDEAWTWEHMALTRARVLSGGEVLRSAVEAAIRAALLRPRDRVKLVEDVRAMRERIAVHKGGTSIWDIKTVRGGQVDLEFIVQFALLEAAARHPDVLHTNLPKAIARLGEVGALDAGATAICADAARLYAAVSEILALCISGPFVPADAPSDLKSLLAKTSESDDFGALAERLEAMQSAVCDLFERVVV